MSDQTQTADYKCPRCSHMAVSRIALAAHLAEHPFRLSDLRTLLDWRFWVWIAIGVGILLAHFRIGL